MTNPNPSASAKMPKPNHLISESSPYLLQHAYNPVAWYAWNDEALALAKKENKLILVSIGYSACHWCHVMERESFEDEATAAIMNERFICIKIDREERPDIDQVYMHAVQLISGQGGWPLNCFTLPDGRPLYGGTYFRNEQWKEILLNLSDLYKNDPDKVYRYAKQLTEGVQQSEIVTLNADENSISSNDIKELVEVWAERFDKEEGGTRRAPKFPLPNNWQFLLRYGATQSESILNQVKLTLNKMAMGGIYDQLGGGFARYATDSDWKVPHFEKMLYDNAQLVELYSEAYQLTHSPLYFQTVRETLDFIERELTSPEGLFYSALDADSEGLEGKFYVWTKEELAEILVEDYSLFSEAYSVNSIGYWEEGNYILLRKNSEAELAEKAKLSLPAWQQKIREAKQKLFAIRSKRIRPGLDHKILMSWNAMMVKGYVAAYNAFGENVYLQKAMHAANLLLTKGKSSEGGLYRIPQMGKESTSPIHGFLEDYALVIDALIALYQATFSESWLREARALTEYALLHFQDSISPLFYFTSNLDKPLVARKMELMDNVMPGSNSVMAKNLFTLGRILDEEKFTRMSEQMLKQVQTEMPKYGSGYSNWAQLALYLNDPFYELVITGPHAESLRRELASHFIPNKILLGTSVPSSLALFQDRFSPDHSVIYVCKNKSCELPVASVSEALLLLSH